MAISGNPGPIPPMYTQNTTILAEKSSLRLYKIVKLHKIGPEMSLVEFLKSYPLAMWQSMVVSVLFHSCLYQTLQILAVKIFYSSSSSPGKFTLCAKIA